MKTHIVIEGGRNSAEGSSVSIFEVNISDKYCIECDFEESHLCGYASQWSGNVNWYVGRGAPNNPALSDGPECDFEESHLCGYASQWSGNVNWYVGRGAPNNPALSDGPGSFLLASSRFTMQSGSISRLFGPPLPGNQTYCLEFFYSLRGFSKSGHTLAVYLYNSTAQKHGRVWTPSDRTRDVWIHVELSIQTQNHTQVMFASMCKSFWNCGSAALDDISLRLGDCELPIGSPLSVPSRCDFENGLCGFTQDKKRDMADWVLIRGPTPTSNTGPKGDHTTGVGHYLYIEASLMLPGHSARLLSRPLRGSRAAQCLLFFYHMYGSGTGSLRVLLRSDLEDGDVVLWERSGEHNVSWMRASVTYQYDRQHQVMFASMCKSFWNCGSAALDDISLRLGDCELPIGSPLSVPSRCDFENGLCGFTQDKKRDMADWVLIRGPTPTSNTGPKGDHTTGVGHYLYIEASLMLPGHSARLLSRPLRGSRAAQCLLFFYHMYGSGTGSLRVLLRSDLEDGDVVLWERSGEHSVSWMRASVTYQYDRQHQIVFEATRGPSILSDTAIDDIKFQKGPCKDGGQ
ncbi:hypothetical protein PDJAM_G00087230 [Pangasius djambal]|uniref:Uncharacterized protein n=1 Tax=Pangasius djambal TaxID=1691987 RepID=A0ACC5Z6G7_9TELE|nr:hypothetical protein [Pangasius djambal]